MPDKMEHWSEIVAEAPGKVIISGEYSVVFGKPAIAAAIDAKTTVQVTPGDGKTVSLSLVGYGCLGTWELSELEKTILIEQPHQTLEFQETLVTLIENNLLGPSNNDDKKYHDSQVAFLMIYLGIGDCFGSHSRRSVNVTVSSRLPVGAGLGSSSAYAVSLLGAINKLYNEPLDCKAINDWAFNVDKYFHGKPSGVDNSIITYGGYILFQQGQIIGKAKPNDEARVMLIDTCVSRSTKTMGLKLREEREKDATRTDQIFNEISEVTTKIWNKLNLDNLGSSSFDPSCIDEHLSLNHSLLEKLGVGHEKLTHIKDIAAKYGFVAKLTGAGCGGGAFVLYNVRANDNKMKKQLVIETMEQDLQQNGYKVRICRIGCSGLSVQCKC